ncbi:hypothetical protein LSH36_859g00017 [Paralvinella palmiformis]|uniref:RabBD domain-containing protein n=1 Tax=Paralvinella palmiformis TaxID=53620 RepID=A0AAD9IZP3_9ANNE|nr:hypothetical protein LSH36_859g00017 [Paralvinella palmiformis]
MLSDIDLKQLTETERDQILQVLRRDDELRKKEQERIRNLKSEVKQLRLKGVIREGQDATKTCARCREPFGWFFNTGAMCPNCQHRVCEKCRQHKDKNTWLCILCFRQMELEAMTNHWFYSKFRKSKRSKKTNRVISGSEIVRASFRRPGRASEDAAAASSSLSPYLDYQQTLGGCNGDGEHTEMVESS